MPGRYSLIVIESPRRLNDRKHDEPVDTTDRASRRVAAAPAGAWAGAIRGKLIDNRLRDRKLRQNAPSGIPDSVPFILNRWRESIIF
jgi:hypothetical protein